MHLDAELTPCSSSAVPIPTCAPSTPFTSAPASSAFPHHHDDLHRRCRRLLRRARRNHCRYPRLGLPHHRRQLRGTAPAAAAADCACGFEPGTEYDTLAKGWYPFANARMSTESRGWMAALPKTITFSAGGLRIPRHPRRRRRHQPLRVRLAARCAGPGNDPGCGRCCHRRPRRRAVHREDRPRHVVQSRRHRHAGGRRHARCLVRPRPQRGRPHRAFHPPAGLRPPPRRRRRHAPLRPRQRLCPHTGDGAVAQPRRLPARPARRRRPETAPAHDANSDPGRRASSGRRRPFSTMSKSGTPDAGVIHDLTDR